MHHFLDLTGIDRMWLHNDLKVLDMQAIPD